MKSLTNRQIEFLAMSARGITNAEIAKICFVSLNTVVSTFTEARKRLECKTTTQCVVKAISREEIGLDHDGIAFVPTRE